MRQPIRDDVEWVWEDVHSTAVRTLKNKLREAPTLAYFDITKPVSIQTDASKDGLGVCLMQNARPIAYASRSLTATEQRYAQIEKELLGIVFGLERFHQYVYSKPVTVFTDHKPLVNVVEKDLSKITGRLQLLLLRTIKYQPTVKYLPGKLMFMADTLSRAYTKDPVQEDQDMCAVVHSVSKHLAISSEKRVFSKLRKLMKYCNKY